MNEVTRKLIEQRNSAWTSMQDLLTRAEKEEGGLSGELRVSYDKAKEEFQRLGSEIDERKEADEIAKRMAAPEAVIVGGGAPEQRDDKAVQAEKREAAFWRYVRRGQRSPELGNFRDISSGETIDSMNLEARDLSDITGTAGGFTVPQGFLARITERQRYWGPMRQIANKLNTSSGQDLPWPSNDDTSVVASVLGENVQISEADINFTQKTLKAYIWTSGLVRVPNTLLNDSAFDIAAFLTGLFAARFGRGQNTAFTLGAGHGSNTAQGLVPGLQAGANLGVTTAAPTAVSYADLVALRFKVDPAYRANAAWMVSDDLMSKLYQLTDGSGRLLFYPAGAFGSIVDDRPDTLMGRPVYVNNDLSPVAATNITAVFGDFSRAYLIRDVLDMQLLRLTERYADYLQTGFFAFMRTDGLVDDSYSAAILTQHA